MVYDFDGTLSPQPMQEYTVLPKIGVKPKQFWKEVSNESRETVSEAMLVYMRLLLQKAENASTHIGRNDLKRMGRAIKYFPGVKRWFARINNFVKKEGKGRIKIKHYIVSAGLREILEGTSIKKQFTRIYASEYHFNHHDVATFPKLLITDTAKTQYLFRINKGKEDLAENINEHMPESLRPIPFSNMIYIGDGITDVPSMAVTKSNGGNTIAVYKKNSRKGMSVCEKLLEVGRVHFIAQADYSLGSHLDKRVKILLRSVIPSIEYQRELFDCRKVHRMTP
jgi:2-hydroxy-3-keto-5-methylthiopentenyl-1-phosphate phosphatase